LIFYQYAKIMARRAFGVENKNPHHAGWGLNQNKNLNQK